MKPNRIKSGDIYGVIDWLDAPENKLAAADAVSFEKGKPSDLVNFMIAHDEFKDWTPRELETAIEVASENDLMETKFSFKSKMNKQLLEKIIENQIRAVLKEGVTKVSVGEVEQMMLDITSRLRLLSSRLGDLSKAMPRIQGVADWQTELNEINTQIMNFFGKTQKALTDYGTQEKTPVKGAAP
jgi:hypothetical protein